MLPGPEINGYTNSAHCRSRPRLSWMARCPAVRVSRVPFRSFAVIGASREVGQQGGEAAASRIASRAGASEVILDPSDAAEGRDPHREPVTSGVNDDWLSAHLSDQAG